MNGSTGMRSLVWCPKMHIAGDILVCGFGVFLCARTARWKESLSKLPSPLTFPVMSRFIDLTPISARQLLWGNATELRRWLTPQSFRNRWVMLVVNSGPGQLLGDTEGGERDP